MNLYGYVNNDPSNLTDPSGLRIESFLGFHSSPLAAKLNKK